ncbi:hypothetical protein [Inhella sp.]|uniref:hypothetical protein n=1 Tax=Inhella sp. TaxID=1921806 RepID=UPI0035B39273
MTPPLPRPLLGLVLLAFGAFSLWALLQVGYLGLWQGGFATIGGTQITLDLIVACALLLGYIARDCRTAGRAFWPWLLAVLALGSIGALLYLLWPVRR